MFKKTITRLAYSPALAGELADYARSLRQDVTKRQIGLIFVALAVVVQSFAIMYPSESANSGRSGDFIEGGFTSIDQYLTLYDQNTHYIRDLLTSLGISRSDIQSVQPTNLKNSSGLSLWTLKNRGNENEIPYSFVSSEGAIKTAYYQPLSLEDNRIVSSKPDRLESYTGRTSSHNVFYLLKNSGDLVNGISMSGACPSADAATSSAPVPISRTDMAKCGAKVAMTISAQNLSRAAPAASQSAQPDDRIMYTLTVSNKERYTVSVPVSVGLSDILDYAAVIDKGGGSFDNESKALTWPAVTLQPDSTQTRSYVVRLSSVVPSTARGVSNQASYDCIMSNSFGHTVRVAVSCPFTKTIERVSNELPHTSLLQNVVFAVSVILLSAFFYTRSRQLHTELRLIRHNQHGNL